MSQPEILGKNLQIVFPITGKDDLEIFWILLVLRIRNFVEQMRSLSFFQKIFGCKFVVRFITLYRVLNRFVFNRVLNRLGIQSSVYECIHI